MKTTRTIVNDVLVKGFEPLQGTIAYIAEFHIPLPAKMPIAKKIQMDGTLHKQKPDFDNLCKFINDSLNGCVWSDDKNIAIANIYKYWTSRAEGWTDLRVYDLNSYTEEVLFKFLSHKLDSYHILEDEEDD